MMKTLTIVGLGVCPAKHLTLAGIAALSDADMVLLLHQNAKELTQLVPALEGKVLVDMESCYKRGDRDLSNYERWMELIHESLSLHRKVVVAIPGQPRVGVTLLQWLEDHPPSDTHIVVQEGISSINTIINQVNMDPIERGCALLEANRILLFRQAINPEINNVIYHVCSVGTNKTNYHDATIDNHLELLIEYLLRFFSPEHEVILCQSSELSDSNNFQVNAPLMRLAEFKNYINFSTTLVIPATAPTDLDERFLAMIGG